MSGGREQLPQTARLWARASLQARYLAFLATPKARDPIAITIVLEPSRAICHSGEMRQEQTATIAPPQPTLRTRLVSRIITFAALFQRPMTLGVRGLVLDADDSVLLVRHTYVPGFYLPGGGVESGETMLQALTRELMEEGAVRILGAPALHGVYLNRRVSTRDHVALYVVRHFRCEGLRKPDHEIAEAGFFPRDDLPPDTTPATRARIAEVLDGAPLSPYW